MYFHTGLFAEYVSAPAVARFAAEFRQGRKPQQFDAQDGTASLASNLDPGGGVS